MGERLCEELVAQLAAARQEVDELAPVRQELADLQIKYTEAHDHTCEAGEKLLDLIESMHMDAAEIKWLRKEHDDAQQRIDFLEGKLWGEKDLKVMIEAVTARLAMEVSQRQEKARILEAEVAQRRDEARKL